MPQGVAKGFYELRLKGVEPVLAHPERYPYVAKDPNLDTVLYVMNGILSTIFLLDFTYRLFTAESKSRYFFRQFGWADLLASLPQQVVLVTHHLDLLAGFDRVVVLAGGRIVADGSPAAGIEAYRGLLA